MPFIADAAIALIIFIAIILLFIAATPCLFLSSYDAAFADTLMAIERLTFADTIDADADTMLSFDDAASPLIIDADAIIFHASMPFTPCLTMLLFFAATRWIRCLLIRRC